MKPKGWILCGAICLLGPVNGRQVPLSEQGPQKASDPQTDQDIRPLFETQEHANIGDKLSLKYPDTELPGAKFDYKVNGRSLSFGDIISLAGDYFYRWKIGPCPPGISNDWDTDTNKSVARAAEYADTLRTDWQGYLGAVQDLVQKQAKELAQAVAKGSDPAQKYVEIADRYDRAYTIATLFGYVAISLCNWDHFGDDAIKAYQAGHSAALLLARQAFDHQDALMLKEAYFLEAYTQHFLTDIFSTGHMRVPRRALHSPGFTLERYPGDRCSQKQHDEDCANGLWVTNRLGESWAAYGDKQLSQGRSAKNFQQVVQTAQLGVDEVWQTFKTGQIPIASEFAALDKVPILSNISTYGNSVPLFQINSKDPKTLMFRQRVDSRGFDGGRKKLDVNQKDDEWLKIRKHIEEAKSTGNLYVFNKGFASETSFAHMGLYGNDLQSLMTNVYGDVDAGSFGKFWSMQAQMSTSMPPGQYYLDWTDAVGLGNGTVSLVGRLQTQSKATVASHMGFRVGTDISGHGHAELLWEQKIEDGRAGFVPGEVVYGHFSNDSHNMAIVKYFDSDSLKPSAVEVWSIRAAQGKLPVRFIGQVGTTSLNFLLPHKIDAEDKHMTVVGHGINGSYVGIWHFIHWSTGYNKSEVTTITEPGAYPAQALLADPDTSRLFRIHYGRSYSTISRDLRIDTFETARDVTTGSTIFKNSAKSQSWPITWPATQEEDYLLWQLSDIDGDGIKDLAAYTSQEHNIFVNVIVFPGTSTGGFDHPVISAITLPEDIALRVTADFMTPWSTSRSSYTYPGGQTTDAAFTAFFDNFGLVGARIVAPVSVRGTFKYELKGQAGSIAGQRANFLGTRPKKWMGRRQRPVAVGLVALK